MRELYKRRPKVITAEDKRAEEDWEEEWASEAFELEEQRRLLNQRARERWRLINPPPAKPPSGFPGVSLTHSHHGPLGKAAPDRGRGTPRSRRMGHSAAGPTSVVEVPAT